MYGGGWLEEKVIKYTEIDRLKTKTVKISWKTLSISSKIIKKTGINE